MGGSHLSGTELLKLIRIRAIIPPTPDQINTVWWCGVFFFRRILP